MTPAPGLRADPVVVVLGHRRLGLHASHSDLLWAMRLNPRRYPARSQVIRVRDGVQLAYVAVDGFLPSPSDAGMIAGMNGGGGVAE